MKKIKIFQLFSCCILVKGASKGIIADLQRRDFINIPSSFYAYFDKSNRFIEINSVKNILCEQYEDPKEIISFFDDFINQLIEKEYGFFSDNMIEFPALGNISYPNLIDTAIIDVKNDLKFNLESFIVDLNQFNCQTLTIRFFRKVSQKFLKNVLLKLENSALRSVEIIIPQNTYLETQTKAHRFFYDFPRCMKITVYGANRNEYYKLGNFNLYYTDFIYSTENCCGYVSPYYFRTNNDLFFQAQEYNSCLNKKISIDIDGNVKNCPSINKSYGKYDEIPQLGSVLESEGFKFLGKIKKDDIEICQDCEFRYICHDCRAFTVEDKLYSKPKFCKYDPYQGIWN